MLDRFTINGDQRWRHSDFALAVERARRPNVRSGKRIWKRWDLAGSAAGQGFVLGTSGGSGDPGVDTHQLKVRSRFENVQIFSTGTKTPHCTASSQGRLCRTCNLCDRDCLARNFPLGLSIPVSIDFGVDMSKRRSVRRSQLKSAAQEEPAVEAITIAWTSSVVCVLAADMVTVVAHFYAQSHPESKSRPGL